MLLLFAFAAGIYLGLYFNILVLAPFCLLGAGAYLATSISAGQSLLGAATALVLPLVAVQIGYFLGLISRDALSVFLVRLNLRPSKRV